MVPGGKRRRSLQLPLQRSGIGGVEREDRANRAKGGSHVRRDQQSLPRQGWGECPAVKTYADRTEGKSAGDFAGALSRTKQDCRSDRRYGESKSSAASIGRQCGRSRRHFAAILPPTPLSPRSAILRSRPGSG